MTSSRILNASDFEGRPARTSLNKGSFANTCPLNLKFPSLPVSLNLTSDCSFKVLYAERAAEAASGVFYMPPTR